MITELVNFAQNVEIEGFHVKVESFVIQEEFCEQTQCLTVCGVVASVDFEYSDDPFAINLVARWRSDAALFL